MRQLDVVELDLPVLHINSFYRRNGSDGYKIGGCGIIGPDFSYDVLNVPAINHLGEYTFGCGTYKETRKMLIDYIFGIEFDEDRVYDIKDSRNNLLRKVINIEYINGLNECCCRIYIPGVINDYQYDMLMVLNKQIQDFKKQYGIEIKVEIFNSLYNPNNSQVLEGNSFEKFYSIEEALDYYKNCIVEFDCNILPEKGLEIVDFHELYKPKYSNINNGDGVGAAGFILPSGKMINVLNVDGCDFSKNRYIRAVGGHEQTFDKLIKILYGINYFLDFDYSADDIRNDFFYRLISIRYFNWNKGNVVQVIIPSFINQRQKSSLLELNKILSEISFELEIVILSYGVNPINLENDKSLLSEEWENIVDAVNFYEENNRIIDFDLVSLIPEERELIVVSRDDKSFLVPYDGCEYLFNNINKRKI